MFVSFLLNHEMEEKGREEREKGRERDERKRKGKRIFFPFDRKERTIFPIPPLELFHPFYILILSTSSSFLALHPFLSCSLPLPFLGEIFSMRK